MLRTTVQVFSTLHHEDPLSQDVRHLTSASETTTGCAGHERSPTSREV
jgi:hypothetical protein